MSTKTYAVKTHSPGAVLDYSFNWGTPTDGEPWMEVGDTIVTSEWEVSPTGMVLSQEDIMPTAITVVFVGGGKEGVEYFLKNTITTSAGRTDSRVMQLSCRVR